MTLYLPMINIGLCHADAKMLINADYFLQTLQLTPQVLDDASQICACIFILAQRTENVQKTRLSR